MICGDDIERVSQKNLDTKNADVNGMMWSFWEFISEEYCGNGYQKGDEFIPFKVDIIDNWSRYKEKGIISLHEKEHIEKMINIIKNHCLRQY